MILPPQLPDNKMNRGYRAGAAVGGLLLGAMVGGLAAFNITIVTYGNQPHNDTIGAGTGFVFMLIIWTGAGVVLGGLAGGGALAWLSGRNNSRIAAIVLAACGYAGTAICLLGGAVWWLRLQDTAHRDLANVRAQNARKQAELNATRSRSLPQQPSPSPPETVPQSTDPRVDPSMPPQPTSDNAQQATSETQGGADTTASVNSVYGELSYPNATETRIASPSPRPTTPDAVVLQMTPDPLETVIKYYEPKLQVIRQSATEYLGSGKRPGDGAPAIVHVHQGDAGYVYVEMSAG